MYKVKFNKLEIQIGLCKYSSRNYFLSVASVATIEYGVDSSRLTDTYSSSLSLCLHLYFVPGYTTVTMREDRHTESDRTNQLVSSSCLHTSHFCFVVPDLATFPDKDNEMSQIFGYESFLISIFLSKEPSPFYCNKGVHWMKDRKVLYSVFACITSVLLCKINQL